MKIALALGSGGARGYAHIGVIRELEERGHQIVGVSGASMGAVVGSLYAAGALDRFEAWVRGLSQRDVLRLLDVSFAGGGAIRANKIMSVIGEMLDDVRIEELQIPFTAVATDLRARREVWFNRGPTDVAVRASFAIPSVITPAVVGGRLMVDGGVTNPVPLEPLAQVESDLILAVSLTGRRSGLRSSMVEESSDPREQTAAADPVIARSAQSGQPGPSLTHRIRTVAADVRDAELLRFIAARFGHDDAEGPETLGQETDQPAEQGVEQVVEEGRGLENLPGGLRIFDVAISSIDAMESIITAYRMAGNQPDVVVEVPTDACTAFDFHRADEMIALGRALAAQALEREGL